MLSIKFTLRSMLSTHPSVINLNTLSTKLQSQEDHVQASQLLLNVSTMTSPKKDSES